MINIISQNIIDNMQATMNIQNPEEPPPLQDTTIDTHESVLLVLPNMMEQMGEQLVMLHCQQKTPQWSPPQHVPPPWYPVMTHSPPYSYGYLPQGYAPLPAPSGSTKATPPTR